MKKELILAALMGSAATTTLSAQERHDLLASASSVFANNIGAVFLSRDVYDAVRWEYDSETRESRRIPIKVRFRISIVESGVKGEDYTYNGAGELEYEIKIEQVDEATGVVVNSGGNTYFAKHAGGIKYRIFDCDSTATCSEGYGESKFYIFDAPEGRGMKLKTDGIWLGGDGVGKTMVLYEQ